MSALLYNIGDERWYDPEFGPMILRCHFNEDAKPEQVLVDLFGLIEEVGLEVKRVAVPESWARFLPIENGFLWDAWVAHDEDGPPVKVYSTRHEGSAIRTVTVDWAS